MCKLGTNSGGLFSHGAPRSRDKTHAEIFQYPFIHHASVRGMSMRQVEISSHLFSLRNTNLRYLISFPASYKCASHPHHLQYTGEYRNCFQTLLSIMEDNICTQDKFRKYYNGIRKWKEWMK